MVLAGMRERKRGLIINVGSIIANFDAPLVAGEMSQALMSMTSMNRLLACKSEPA